MEINQIQTNQCERQGSSELNNSHICMLIRKQIYMEYVALLEHIATHPMNWSNPTKIQP